MSCFRIFLIFFIPLTKCIEIPELTLLSEKNVYGAKYHMNCVVSGKSMNSAITWIDAITYTGGSQAPSEFNPKRSNQHNCDFRTGQNVCNYPWTQNSKWEIKKPFDKFMLGPVTDRRWEEFQTLYTNGDLQFLHLLDIDSDNFKIHLSIRAKNEAHIHLCDGTSPPNSNCYWIILGGWSGQTSVFRKCFYNGIPDRPNKYAKGSCGVKRDKKEHGVNNILTESEWRHFILKSIGNTIMVYDTNNLEPLLTFTDEMTTINKRHMIVHTLKTPGYWKVHNYEFLFSSEESTSYLGPEIYVDSNPICISMFVTMCKKCTLTITLTYSKGTSQLQFNETLLTSDVEGEWKEEKIISDLPELRTNVRMFISTVCIDCNKEESYWGIDRFEICSVDEIRIQTNDAEKDKVSCQLLKYPNIYLMQMEPLTNLTNMSPQSSCSTGQFGRNCISCSRVLGGGRINCDNNAICELNSNAQSICSCALGYHGVACQSRCNAGWYGLNCQQKCGLCEYAPCDFSSGLCQFNQCTSDYVPPYCNITFLPILRQPPVILEIGHTNCTVQIQSREYSGSEKPIFFRLQIRKHSQTSWSNLKEYLFNYQMPIEIQSLDILTTYDIRAVLIVENNYNSFVKESVPYTNVTTTCEFITLQDIEIRRTNITATLMFKNNSASCRFEDYQLSLDGKQISGSRTGFFNINNLNPFKSYNLTIRNTYIAEILEMAFTTEEGVPGKVKNVQTSSLSASSISIMWQPPDNKNGDIRYYKVYCEHTNYLACNKNKLRDVDLTKILDVESTATSTVIENLLPYSEYAISIIAYTILKGEETVAYATTQPSGKADLSEVPNIKEIVTLNASTGIFLKEPNCTLIKGPLIYYTFVKCSNPWCAQTYTNESFTKPFLHLTNLLPYSDYVGIIQVGRENGSMVDGHDITATFKTKTSVPNQVTNIVAYSKSETSLYLRFEKPYPPTGELSDYRAKFCYHRGILPDYCLQKDFPHTPCKLWENLDCVIILNLYSNTDYFVTLQAKNSDTNFNLESSRLSLRTVQEASDAPENITAVWDNYHNLTLTWAHPSIINGPLSRFVIQVFSETIQCYDGLKRITEEDYKNVYVYTIPFTNCYSSILTVEVSGFNIMQGKTGRLTKLVSPPPTPLLTTGAVLTTASNTSVTLSLPTIGSLTQESFLYIFVSKETELEIDANESLTDSDNTWIAAIFDSEKIQNIQGAFIVGNDATMTVGNRVVHNRVLDAETNYTVKLLLTNRFGSLKRSNVYDLQIGTTGMKLEPEATESGSILYALLLLLLLPLIVCLVLKRTKKGAEVSAGCLTKFGLRPTSVDSLQCVTQCSSALSGCRTMQTSSVQRVTMNQLKTMAFNGKLLSTSYTSKSKGHTRPNYDKKYYAPVTTGPDVIPLTNKRERKLPPNAPQKPKRMLAPPVSTNANTAEASLHTSNSPPSHTNNNKFSKPIRIIDFEKYVKEAINNEELEKQHQLFPRGQTKPWDYGLLPQNKTKNRYNNLIAYDHSRVKLAKINNDNFSDYINANYIEGINSKKGYIATQGPKAATVNDFWRMIWQERVCYIVMVANVMEGGKKKSEQYWPNINENHTYGNITVAYESTQVFADFEYRTFLVTKADSDEKRQVEQLHFTSWPDHGVPLYSQSLVPFLRKLLAIPQGISPIVVHCSAGVGRTGTIILTDLCLRMAAREGFVDILKHQENLREQRANLVDNIEQYKLAHLVLLECLIAPETSILCDDRMESEVLQVLESGKIERQMQYIEETAWQDQAMRPVLNIEPNPAWAEKNRFQDIIPTSYGRVYISRYPVTEEHSDYINAIEVDGFRTPQKFICTQQPMPHTVSDFWRMIDEKDVSVIVSLHKINTKHQDSCIFWPNEKLNTIQPVPYLTINFHTKSSNDYFSTITLHIHNNKNKNSKHIVYLLVAKGWPFEKPLPVSEDSLLKLWDETERLSKGAHPIVVSCFDGAKASGLFTALAFVIEKIKLEQICDVCLAIRTIRRNRKQFVTESDQFEFLYRAALCYVKSFELYSNFS